eukprot:3024632-Prorocentrum_lima.AAC.1
MVPRQAPTEVGKQRRRRPPQTGPSEEFDIRQPCSSWSAPLGAADQPRLGGQPVASHQTRIVTS